MLQLLASADCLTLRLLTVSVAMPNVQMHCFVMQGLCLKCPTLRTTLSFLEGEALFSTFLLGCIESLLISLKSWHLACLPFSCFDQVPIKISNVTCNKEMFRRYVKIIVFPPALRCSLNVKNSPLTSFGCVTYFHIQNHFLVMAREEIVRNHSCQNVGTGIFRSKNEFLLFFPFPQLLKEIFTKFSSEFTAQTQTVTRFYHCTVEIASANDEKPQQF